MTTNLLPALPDTVTTTLLQVITTAADTWTVQMHLTLNAQKYIHWSELANHVTPATLHTLKLHATTTLRQRKPATALNYYHATLYFVRWLEQHQPAHLPFQWSSLDEELFRDYVTYCYQTLKGKGAHAVHLRQIYTWGANNAYPGFDPYTQLQLNQLRLKNSAKGAAVRFHHPTKSAFDDAERQQILEALSAERGTPLQRALIWILFDTGARPIDLALLQNQHLLRFNEGADLHYQLLITEVKQPGSAPTYILLKISNELGHLLESLQIPNAPPAALLLPRLNTKNHLSAINYHLQRWAKAAGLLARDGQTPLHLFAYRFRRDFATTHIEIGTPPEELAYLMGHKGTGQLRIYVEHGSAFAKLSEDALMASAGSVFRAFRGQLTTKDDAQTADLPETPPLALNCQPTSVCDMAKCARNAARGDFCQLDGAWACFTCKHFRPHADALPEFEIALHDIEQAFPRARSLSTNPEPDKQRPESWLAATYIALTEIIRQIKEQADHEPAKTHREQPLPTGRLRRHRQSPTPVPA